MSGDKSGYIVINTGFQCGRCASGAVVVKLLEAVGSDVSLACTSCGEFSDGAAMFAGLLDELSDELIDEGDGV